MKIHSNFFAKQPNLILNIYFKILKAKLIEFFEKKFFVLNLFFIFTKSF